MMSVTESIDSLAKNISLQDAELGGASSLQIVMSFNSLKQEEVYDALGDALGAYSGAISYDYTAFDRVVFDFLIDETAEVTHRLVMPTAWVQKYHADMITRGELVTQVLESYHVIDADGTAHGGETLNDWLEEYE